MDVLNVLLDRLIPIRERDVPGFKGVAGIPVDAEARFSDGADDCGSPLARIRPEIIFHLDGQLQPFLSDQFR